MLGGEGVRISNGTLTHRYGGGLQLLEHGRMLVTLAGYQGNHPPVDPEGFTFPVSVRNRYERLR